MKIILYFTMGYPDRATLSRFIASIPEDTVQYIELGFPSPDPKYDGPEIRKTHAAASFDAEDLEEIAGVARDSAEKVYALRYVSDFIQEPSFTDTVRNAEFSGIIAPDLLTDYFQERIEIVTGIERSGLEFIPFINPSTTDPVISEVLRTAGSWIYYGLLPSTGIMVPYDVNAITERIHGMNSGRKVVVGFGIRSLEDARKISSTGAYGVAIGTMLIRYLEHGDVEAFSSLITRFSEVAEDVQ